MDTHKSRIELRVIERLGVERRNYPVTVGVPFPPGELRSVDQVRVLDPAGAEAPSQVEKLDLSDWPDGSVKGLRIDFQATLAAQTTADYAVDYGKRQRASTPPRPVTVQEDADCVRVETGPLAFEISKRRFRLFESVRLDGVEMIDRSRPRGFSVVSPDGKTYESGLDPAPRVHVEARGPLRAALRITGAHTAADGDQHMDFDVRIEAFADSPVVKVTYGFYNMGRHVEDRLVNPGRGSLFRVPYSSLQEVRHRMPLRLEGETEALLAGSTFYVHRVRGVASLFYGWCRRPHDREGMGHVLRWRGEDRVLYPGTMSDARSGCQLVDQGGGRTMQIRFAPHDSNVGSLDVTEVLSDEPDGSREVFYLGSPDGWTDLSNARRGVTTFVRQFDMLPPKLVEVTSDGVEVALWPARAGTLDVGQGSGKSHELFFVFHHGTGVEQKIDWLCEAFREPLACGVEPEWLQHCGLLGDLYPAGAAHRPNFEKTCRTIPLDTGGPGMMNYPELVVTTSTDKGVAHNNDGDRVMSLILQSARVSDPACFVAARDQARHTMDVDFIRYNPDPLMHEGIHMHSYDHVTAISQPSHVWIEGLLDYYYLTGDPQAIEVCRAVGRHLCRQVYAERLMCFCDEREAGWPLIMLSELYRATGEPELKKAVEHLLDMLEAWQDKVTGIWHTRWRHGRYPVSGGGFCRAVIFCGLYKWWRATGDERAKEIFRRGIFTFADEVAEMTDFTARNFLNLEALAYAWRMLGDRTCMEKGMRAWVFLTRRGQGEYPVHDLGALRGLFPFMQTADELGLVPREWED